LVEILCTQLPTEISDKGSEFPKVGLTFLPDSKISPILNPLGAIMYINFFLSIS